MIIQKTVVGLSSDNNKIYLFIMETIAKKICQYNGQTGTQKQIEKCIKNFHFSIELMQQFAKNRINL